MPPLHEVTELDRQTIRSSLLCRTMDGASVARIIDAGRIIKKRKSEYLFQQDDRGSDLFFVLEGWVQIKREEADGSFTMIASFNQGDSLAEAAAFLQKGYPGTAQAMTPMRLLAINGATVLDLLPEDRGILTGVLSSLFSKLHELVNEVETLKSRTLRERLALFLLSNMRNSTGKEVVALPYSKALIAAQIGTSPEQLSRTFRELQAFGVTVSGQNAIVEDAAMLRAQLQKR